MKVDIKVIACFTVLLIAPSLYAQRVLYSPFLGTQPATRFEVIGKTGNFYWIQKSRVKYKSSGKPSEPWVDDKELRFEIYDARMNPVRSVPCELGENLVKEYLVTSDDHLDQLVLRSGAHKTIALINRYTPEGDPAGRIDTVAMFGAVMKCGDFLLVRSQDKSKILLLGFETVVGGPTKTHARLFDSNWRLLSQFTYSDLNISKPLVQYDLIDYPIEDYSSASLKLANSGQWTMVLSSGTNHNYHLLFLDGLSGKYVYREIKLASGAVVEDAGVFVDNTECKGFAGILSRSKTATIKNVRLVTFDIDEFRLARDTSFIFNTISGNKTRNETLFEEYFMMVPGRGFLFLKEYGRMLAQKDEEEETGRQTREEKRSVVESEIEPAINKDEYTRYDNIAGIRSSFDRGDLTLYYFPAYTGDTCWSGIINKEQTTELGTSYLSYVFLPRADKLFFLYNSLYRNGDEYSSATVLDSKGNPMEEGIEYWKINNTLVFQKAKQISANELAIPYQHNMRKGFAIIHL